MRHAVRVTRPTLVAAAAAALLVTGCSGDGESDDELAGAETQAPESTDAPEEEDAAGAEPPDDGIERPEIELPEDMVNVFEDTETGDETRDAIIADVQQRINGVDMALAQSDPNIEAVEFYHTLDGEVSIKSYIRSAADSNRSWTGTTEYYDFSVSIPDGDGNPSVTYCRDTTNSYTKDLETGEQLDKGASGPYQYRERVWVDENDQGVWQVVVVDEGSEEGDRECHR